MSQRKSDERLASAYQGLDQKFRLTLKKTRAIRSDLLLVFPFAHAPQAPEVVIDTEEFSALCPWTGLPDLGTLSIRYRPDQNCLELKSLKYYLLSFRDVGIVQEHAAVRILDDLVRVVAPRQMTVELDYRLRGGIHTLVRATFPADPGVSRLGEPGEWANQR